MKKNLKEKSPKNVEDVKERLKKAAQERTHGKKDDKKPGKKGKFNAAEFFASKKDDKPSGKKKGFKAFPKKKD